MGASNFLNEMSVLRQSDYQALMDGCLRSDEFNIIVDKILQRGAKYRKENSPVKEKVESTVLSTIETNIKSYFQEHSFPDMEYQKSVADLITLLTGVNASRFIVMRNKIMSKKSFPGFMCIVPITPGNESNGHHYRVGDPLINFGSGFSFYDSSGSSGDTMSVDPYDYRMGTEDEIKELLVRLIKRNFAFAETLAHELL